MVNLFNFLINHGEDIFNLVSSIVMVASIIAKLTPTEVNNKIIGRLLKLVDVIAINNKPTEVR